MTTSPRRAARLSVTLAATLLTASTLTGCGVFGSPDLVIYNAQHAELLDEIIPLFEEESGLDVELRSGKDLEFANQIVEEGEDSPADVFLTENSPAMSIVDNAGLFAELPESATASIPEQYVAADRAWTGFLARSTVAMYNTDSMTEADMPGSILDFALPEWKGRVAFSPTGADFQAIVSAVLELEGEEATAAWLQGLKDNGVIVQNNLVVMQSVDSGEVDAGIAYHYYWYRDREENGTDSDSSALHFFGNQDPGAFLSISGAGILASSEHQAAAEEFVTWLTGTEAQQAMAESYALEYPLNPDATLNPDVKPFDELEPPEVDVASLNGPQVTDLMTAAGLL
ncbi:iron ABC transporter substrate-binding protein [Nocardioides zhouii]|uniref:Iron ABC transporter substrate-binding protein n=1 Tax=Nocardioides zhouii TaxID=1168729 RepID=A0A4V1RQ12_9ACTN|nr:iron ABC transporter substrate-binding protein [Nocardioides zhouii]RYC11247.1 iron ABC transporter substrate-binding protein [Nocardioides zhouii]